MAPEVFSAGEGNTEGFCGIKADIFSIGIILFCLNFGQNPWPQASSDEKLFTRF
jgi:serine/threonine protein kinase